MLFLSNPCQTSAILKVIYFIFEIIKLAFIIVPIGLIVMITVDFAKNVMSNEDEMKKNLSLVFKRVIMCVAIFFVPTIVRLAMNLVDIADPSFNIPYRECIENANLSKIEEIEGYEETAKSQEKAIEEYERNQQLTVEDGDSSSNKTITSSDNKNDDSSNEDAKEDVKANAQSFLDALDRMSTIVEKDYKNGKKWHYSNSHTEGTFEKERKNGRETNCAKYVSWALVDIGVLKSGQSFYKASSNTIEGSAASKIQNSKKLKIINGNGKTAKSLISDGKLKAGDIVLWNNEQHTNVYAGNKKWYDAGRQKSANGCYNEAGKDYFKTLGPVSIGYLYESWGIWKIIRVKG